jgi:hypothetical protein
VSRDVRGAGRGLILGAATIGIFILGWRESTAKPNAETLRTQGAQRRKKDLTHSDDAEAQSSLRRIARIGQVNARGCLEAAATWTGANLFALCVVWG